MFFCMWTSSFHGISFWRFSLHYIVTVNAITLREKSWQHSHIKSIKVNKVSGNKPNKEVKYLCNKNFKSGLLYKMASQRNRLQSLWMNGYADKTRVNRWITNKPLLLQLSLYRFPAQGVAHIKDVSSCLMLWIKDLYHPGTRFKSKICCLPASRSRSHVCPQFTYGL